MTGAKTFLKLLQPLSDINVFKLELKSCQAWLEKTLKRHLKVLVSIVVDVVQSDDLQLGEVAAPTVQQLFQVEFEAKVLEDVLKVELESQDAHHWQREIAQR